MKHADIRQKLSAYLDDAVTPDERLLIEEHLQSCRICSVALAELKKTVCHVKNLEQLEPPAWMAHKIMVQVKLEAEKKTNIFRWLFFPLHIKLPIEAMAMILVTVTGYLVFRTVQPEMQIVEPPVQEEYGRAMPETPTAPVPLKALPEIKKPAMTKDEKSLPLKPLEQKPQRTARDADAPVTAPQIGYDPARNKSVAPAGQIPEYMEQERAKPAPMPEADRSMQTQDGAASGTRAKAERFGERRMESMPEKPEANFSITVFSSEYDANGRTVEKEVKRLGGRIVMTELHGNVRVLTVQLEGKKIKELMARLGMLGKVTGREVVPGSTEESTELTVQVEIRQDSPQQ